jgi:monofunctional biosynthetic peptidoglycan transglycosylase
MARKKKPRTRLRRVLRACSWALLGVVLFTVLLVLPLRWFDPATSAFMLQDDTAGELQHEWVSWRDIGFAAKLAVVASEDQRFADHFGLDIGAIRKAVNEQDERGYMRGASTISQQTAKNLFLWPGRSFGRKGLEAWLTIWVEACLPKQRILEIYLNVAEFGPGIYGIEAASRHYFGTSAARLSDSQAALLAAVLPNPKQIRPSPRSEYVRERQQWILSQMARLRREAWITRIE